MLKNLFRFYINSSIHVSLAVVCLTIISFQNFDIPLEKYFLGFVFFGTVTGYNFVKYAGISGLHHRSLAKNLQIIQIFSFISFLAFMYFFFLQPISIIIFGGIMGIFTILYTFPVFSKNRNLRELKGVKVFVIGIVWAGVTVIMPFLFNKSGIHWDHLVEFIQRVFFVVVLMLPFEIRDLKFDMVQLGTIPQKFGVQGSKIIGYLLIGFFILLEFLKQESTMAEVFSVMVVGMVTYSFLKRSKIHQKQYYASFWVEAVPIFWVFILQIMIRIT